MCIQKLCGVYRIILCSLIRFVTRTHDTVVTFPVRTQLVRVSFTTSSTRSTIRVCYTSHTSSELVTFSVVSVTFVSHSYVILVSEVIFPPCLRGVHRLTVIVVMTYIHDGSSISCFKRINQFERSHISNTYSHLYHLPNQPWKRNLLRFQRYNEEHLLSICRKRSCMTC